MTPESKAVRESVAVMTQMVMPNDTNPHGTIFGGRVLEWVDICGAIAAGRHARSAVVTASIDQVDFLTPIKAGHVVILTASVNHVGNSSMEVGVRVDSEFPLTGEQHHSCTAYLTYVALDSNGSKKRVPRLILETAEEERRYAEAEQRRAIKLQTRHARKD